MIEFRCDRRHKDYTPIICDNDIRDYTEMLVSDYKPKLLKEPGKINPFHFVESYLGATVDYQDIYYREGESQIAGATIFNDDRIKVFDRENMCTKTLPVPADTILIDNSIMEDGKEGFALFTCLHEGGHFCMHPAVYRENSEQLSLFPTPNQNSSVVSCKRSVISDGVRKSTQEWTELEWREHQANMFAASVSMPRPTFIPFTKELIRKAGHEEGIWIYEEHELSWDAILSSDNLENIKFQISQTFGVSKTAAFVHMKKLGLYVSKEEYMETKNSLFAFAI